MHLPVTCQLSMKSIFFSVGEPSGDQHAARLIEEIRDLGVDVQARGFGGAAMSEAGCRLDLDLTQHAVVGLIEVLPKIRQFFRFADQAEAIFKAGGIDAVVLVDFPGFNWHIARRAKRYGIPVYYYCPPQLWAWGGWRARKMRRSVDHVLAVLPIEETYFADRGIPVTYVGHPFFDAVDGQRLDRTLMSRLDVRRRDGETLVAVLPGSRTHEVHRNWPIMLESIRKLSRRHRDTKFLVAAYRDSHCLWCRGQLNAVDANLPVEFYVGRTSEIIEASRCAMMVSGSVSLELMARQTPAAVVYRVGRFLHAFGKCVIGVDSLTLPNLMGKRKVFPELVSSGKPQPAIEFLTESVDAMLSDEFYYQHTLRHLDELRRQYATAGASRRAAAWLVDALDASDDASPVRRAA